MKYYYKELLSHTKSSPAAMQTVIIRHIYRLLTSFLLYNIYTFFLHSFGLVQVPPTSELSSYHMTATRLEGQGSRVLVLQ